MSTRNTLVKSLILLIRYDKKFFYAFQTLLKSKYPKNRIKGVSLGAVPLLRTTPSRILILKIENFNPLEKICNFYQKLLKKL